MPFLQEGCSIRGTYEVERFLGEGAFAEVYRVRHRFLGRQAMKVFKRLDMTEAEVLDALTEAILLTHLKHPNIVSVHDANVFDSPKGTCGYFTMEYVPGGSLDRFWRSHGASVVPVETTVEIMRQVCRGLAVAHASTPPIIHRDIKPQNILVGYETDGLRARVSDFGLAKKVNPLTLLATAAGTLAFKPPETFSKSKADSCAADVWALGVTTYLEKIPDMEEVSALLEAAKGDPDSANKAEKRLLELRIQLDKAEDLLKWPALVADANKALDDLDTLIEQHGNDDHRERAEKLREQIDELVEQKRSEPLRKKMEQVADVHREILFEQPGFWLGFFNYLVEERAKMSDQQSAERLINQGRQCINRGNVQGLRNVVAQLLGLLPRDVAETIQRGYQSGVLK